jgi:hypothetical protein
MIAEADIQTNKITHKKYSMSRRTDLFEKRRRTATPNATKSCSAMEPPPTAIWQYFATGSNVHDDNMSAIKPITGRRMATAPNPTNASN